MGNGTAFYTDKLVHSVDIIYQIFGSSSIPVVVL